VGSAVEAVVESASGAVRAAIDRISPRRRPAEEAELLALVPDRDDVMSQRGGQAADADAAAARVDLTGRPPMRGQAATWVEHPANGTFSRLTHADALRRDEAQPGAKRTLLEALGLTTRAGEPGSVEHLAVLATHARAILSATLAVSEGVLAGMSLLHILVVEQCAQRAFLVVSYLRAARATQQTFHIMCTLACLSSLLALNSAGAQLSALAAKHQRWDIVQQARAASYQQAAAGVVSLLYAVALVCSLLTVRALAPRPPAPRRVYELCARVAGGTHHGITQPSSHRPRPTLLPPHPPDASSHLPLPSLPPLPPPTGCCAARGHAPPALPPAPPQAEMVWRWSLLEPEAVILLGPEALAQLYADQFDQAYPLYRGLSGASRKRAVRGEARMRATSKGCAAALLEGGQQRGRLGWAQSHSRAGCAPMPPRPLARRESGGERGSMLLKGEGCGTEPAKLQRL
jgi:hypothetical protein